MSNLLKALGKRFVKGSTGGPDAEARSKSGSQIVAIAYDSGGRELAEAAADGRGRLHVHRPHPRLGRPARGRGRRSRAPGALGPVDGFGLAALTEGCRWAGLEEKGARRRSRSVRLSSDPAARRRLGLLAGAALLALAAGIAVGSGWRRTAPRRRSASAPRARRCGRRSTASACASRSAS